MVSAWACPLSPPSLKPTTPPSTSNRGRAEASISTSGSPGHSTAQARPADPRHRMTGAASPSPTHPMHLPCADRHRHRTRQTGLRTHPDTPNELFALLRAERTSSSTGRMAPAGRARFSPPPVGLSSRLSVALAALVVVVRRTARQTRSTVSHYMTFSQASMQEESLRSRVEPMKPDAGFSGRQRKRPWKYLQVRASSSRVRGASAPNSQCVLSGEFAVGSRS